MRKLAVVCSRHPSRREGPVKTSLGGGARWRDRLRSLVSAVSADTLAIILAAVLAMLASGAAADCPDPGSCPGVQCTVTSQPGATTGGERECAHPYYWRNGLGSSTVPDCDQCICPSAGFYCNQPRQPSSPFIRVVNPLCNAQAQTCAIELRVPLEFPGNIQNGGCIRPVIHWFAQAVSP